MASTIIPKLFLSQPDTRSLTMSAPGAACPPTLAEAPPDLHPTVPTQCQLQSFALSYTVPSLVNGVEPMPDSVLMPLQTLQDARVTINHVTGEYAGGLHLKR